MALRTKDKSGPEEMIDFLNYVYSLDPEWLNRLINFRPCCNLAVAKEQDIQVFLFDGQHAAGFLGLLNGFYGSFEKGHNKGCGPIAALVDSKDGIDTLKGFCLFDKGSPRDTIID